MGEGIAGDVRVAAADAAVQAVVAADVAPFDQRPQQDGISELFDGHFPCVPIQRIDHGFVVGFQQHPETVVIERLPLP